MNIAPILKARFIVVALAGLLVSALLPGQASAYYWWVESACGHGHRVSAGSADWDANCLSAGWDNSPPFSSRRAGGSTHWVKSKCSHYGVVYVSVDVQGHLDLKIKLTNSATWSDGHEFNNVRDIACCISLGDNLCFKRQIEGEWIKHVTVTGGGWSQNWVDVRTQGKRYKFCRDNPDDIYCEVDPEGDALDAPSYNCGDHYCTASDCEWNWDRSAASENCFGHHYNEPEFSISDSDGSSRTCTVDVVCNYHSGNDQLGVWSVPQEFSAESWQFDELDVCDGRIQIGSC